MTFLPTFNNVAFRQVERDGKPWMTSADLARALGYRQSDSVSRIYDRNKDEFTPTMTAVELMKRGAANDTLPDRQIDGPAVRTFDYIETRIFSLRGAHLIAMFAKTPIAAEFRRWVLDVLERLSDPPPLPAPPMLADMDPAWITSRVGLLREARRMFGVAAARELWVQVGFPAIIAAIRDFDPLGDHLIEPARRYLIMQRRVQPEQLVKALGLEVSVKALERAEFLLTMFGWEKRKIGHSRNGGKTTAWFAPSEVLPGREVNDAH